MDRPSEKWLVVSLGLVVAFLVVNVSVAFRNTRQLHDDSYLVAHTHEVLESLSDLFSTLKDAETGQRGFLITGEVGYLKPYQVAMASVDSKIGRVKRLMADDRQQQARIATLERLVRDKLDELARTIALRRGPEGFPAAQKEVLTHLGKNWMDEIRAVVADMQRDEQALLRERQAADDRAYRTAFITGGLADALAILSVIGFIGILRRHLNARLKAASEIYAHREWLRTTLASIGDAVIATDTASRVTFLNAIAESLTGWKQGEAIGVALSTVFRIVNEETRRTVEDPTTRALREGTVVGLANHTILIARDGAERPIDDSAAPIKDERGHVVGVVLVFRDATARRRAEAMLKEADRRKDEFLATLAHELRNPLAPIRNAVEVLRNAQGDTRLAEEARNIMERQLTQMVRLIDDLMEASRINQGRLQLRKERIELSSTVHSAVEETQPLIDEARHELTVTLPPEPVYIEADPTRLAQVFSNLLNNAAKYTEKGGHIWLQATRLEGQIRVSVRDTGIGIDARHLPHVFEMFSQVVPALERSQGGLGIGLALVRGLVELHGGTVEARSEGPGRGSEFVVRLPIAEESAPQEVGQDVPEKVRSDGRPPSGAGAGAGTGAGGGAGAGPKRRILVVDDNFDAASSLAMLLRRKGHVIETANDGLEAVRAVAAFHPDVVLLDIGLPKLNGYEVARQIRQQEHDRSLCLIALTGWGQEDDKRRALAAGFDHHLTKPVDPAALDRLLSGPGA